MKESGVFKNNKYLTNAKVLRGYPKKMIGLRIWSDRLRIFQNK